MARTSPWCPSRGSSCTSSASCHLLKRPLLVPTRARPESQSTLSAVGADPEGSTRALVQRPLRSYTLRIPSREALMTRSALRPRDTDVTSMAEPSNLFKGATPRSRSHSTTEWSQEPEQKQRPCQSAARQDTAFWWLLNTLTLWPNSAWQREVSPVAEPNRTIIESGSATMAVIVVLMWQNVLVAFSTPALPRCQSLTVLSKLALQMRSRRLLTSTRVASGLTPH
mmetsp:Transcript_77109/g.218206  ORF Transcript_77109/g.218206 Transcript_77109/m.218206 type:complete len:225 (-) Transcript_77109:177-851(-)